MLFECRCFLPYSLLASETAPQVLRPLGAPPLEELSDNLDELRKGLAMIPTRRADIVIAVLPD